MPGIAPFSGSPVRSIPAFMDHGDAPSASSSPPTVPRTPAARGPAAALAGLLLLCAGVSPLGAQSSPPSGCEGAAGFDRLDFWVGTWDVLVEGRNVGANRIEKVLSGCAVTEQWRSARGGRGMSVFYYLPAAGEWKQVWVTSDATRPGGVKEKTLVDGYGGPGVRFLGRVRLPDGGSYLDRTTLVPLGDGRVRQLIETSRDGGSTWTTGFDAVYVPAGEQ